MAQQIKVNSATGNIQIQISRGAIGPSTTANVANTALNLNAASTSNVIIGGGTANYVLSTDGAGNTSWVAQTGGGGTYGDSNVVTLMGTFGSNTISTTGLITGNGGGLSNIAGANVSGAVANATLADFATTANAVAGANVSGEVAFSATANSVAGANVTGVVANATHSTISDSANSVAVANVSGIGNIATVNLDGNTANYLDGTGAWTPVASGSSSQIANGTSNVDIATVNGNVTIGVAGTANIAQFTTLGSNIVGDLNVTDSINANTFSASSGNIATYNTAVSPITISGVDYYHVSNANTIQSGGVVTGVNGEIQASVLKNAIRQENAPNWEAVDHANIYKQSFLAVDSNDKVYKGGEVSVRQVQGLRGTTIVSSDSTTNEFTCSGTGDPTQVLQQDAGSVGEVVFTGTTFGGIVAGTTYYIANVVDQTHFQISATEGGPVLALTSGTGTMIANDKDTVQTGYTVKFSGFASEGTATDPTGLTDVRLMMNPPDTFYNGVVSSGLALIDGQVGSSGSDSPSARYTYAQEQYGDHGMAMKRANGTGLNREPVIAGDRIGKLAWAGATWNPSGTNLAFRSLPAFITGKIDASFAGANGERPLQGIEFGVVSGTGTNSSSTTTHNMYANGEVSFSGPLISQSLSATGNVSGGNLTTAGNIDTSAGIFNGDGGGLSNIAGANVSGAVSFATTANSVAVANVAGIGNIATTNLDGNSANYLTGTGTWAPAGGSTSPGGFTDSVQYNDGAGGFDGDNVFTYQESSKTLSLNGTGGAGLPSTDRSKLQINNGGLNVSQNNVDGGVASMAFSSYFSTTYIAPYTFFRARGTGPGAELAVQSGDAIKNESYIVYGDAGNPFYPVGQNTVSVSANDGAGNVQITTTIQSGPGSINRTNGSQINLDTNFTKITNDLVVGNDNTNGGNIELNRALDGASAGQNPQGFIKKYNRVYGEFFDGGDIIATTADTPEVLAVGATLSNNNIFNTAGTYTVNVGGKYSVSLNAHLLNNSSGVNADAYFWIRQNGSDVSDTMRKINTQNNYDTNLDLEFLLSLNDFDTIQIMWAVENTLLKCQAIAANSAGFTHPRAPSATVAITPVGA